jgi:hypothetical protein
MYRFLVLVISILLFNTQVFSQDRFLSLYLGGTHYSGDLGNGGIPRQIYPAGGIGFASEINSRMLISVSLIYGKIGGNDKFSAKTKARNLSFNSHIGEGSLQFEYNLFNLYEYPVSPFFFTGVSVFNFSPYTKISGNRVFLSPLSTEGQGFISGRKKYKQTQFSIPLGAGVSWALSYNKRIAVFIGLRRTFTDYLDDVSKTYVDYATLVANRGGDAGTLAFRGDEYNGALYPVEGTQRGNPKNKDYYYFSGISFRTKLLPPKGRSNKNNKRRGSTACPVL